MKALSLLSGGLDSRLATRLLQKLGVELEAVNFTSVFCPSKHKDKKCSDAVSAAAEYDIPLRMFDITKELMELVRNPRFGHGSGMNPCIDCKILMLKKAKQYMQECGAKFVITGEVLGERPMSQRKDAMKIVERESGLKDFLLRPLSAKLLEPTTPELNGWIDRERLLDIKGRSRKPQFALAKELGVKDYPTPAGGCLLTDKEYAIKVKDLISHNAWDEENVLLLRYGRHFRISPRSKAVIGRDEKENEKIKDLNGKNDYLLETKDVPGPTAVIKGWASDSEVELSARLVAYYVTKKNSRDKIKIEIIKSNFFNKIVEVSAPAEEEIAKYRIHA